MGLIRVGAGAPRVRDPLCSDTWRSEGASSFHVIHACFGSDLASSPMTGLGIIVRQLFPFARLNLQELQETSQGKARAGN